MSQTYSNSKWPLDGHFKIVCSQKWIRSLADIAVHICQIKRRYAGNFFLKRANEYFFVSGPSNQRVNYMGIKMSQKNSQWYVKYEKAEGDRSAIIQDFRDNEKKKIKCTTGGHFGFY